MSFIDNNVSVKRTMLGKSFAYSFDNVFASGGGDANVFLHGGIVVGYTQISYGRKAVGGKKNKIVRCNRYDVGDDLLQINHHSNYGNTITTIDIGSCLLNALCKSVGVKTCADYFSIYWRGDQDQGS